LARAETFAALGRAAAWPAILLGFTIPISIAADNILLGLIAIASAIALAREPGMVGRILAQPVVRAALLLYALLLVGTLYGERDPGAAGRALGKYLDLALLPLMLAPFVEARARTLGLYALAGAVLLTLAISIGLKLGLVPAGAPFTGNPDNASVFKLDLTHNFVMAYGVFLFLQLGLAAATPRTRIVWIVLAVIAAVDVLLFVRGRTGYVVLFALVLYAGYAWKGARGLFGVSALAAAGAAILLLTPTLFSARIERTLNEARDWETHHNMHESTTMRLEWYRTSLGIIAEHPIVGSGTGAFGKAYAERTRGRNVQPTVNPHNEFLHIAVQLGAAGLAALLWLFYAAWRTAPRLATPLETHLARGLVIAFMIGCLFNSLLLDHTEGLLFAWLAALLYGGWRAPAAPRA
jgi:O-antigen ligase